MQITEPGPNPSAQHFLQVQQSALWQSLHSGLADLVTTAKSPARSLDIGCGPGLFCAQLAERGWRTHGIDRAPDMVDSARLTYPGHLFTVGDCCDLNEIPDQSYELVTAANLLFFLPDPLLAVREMVRVSRRCGVVAMLNPSPILGTNFAERASIAQSLDDWDEAVLRNWARLAEANGTFDSELGHAMFTLAGLSDITYHEIGPAGIAAVVIGTKPGEG